MWRRKNTDKKLHQSSSCWWWGYLHWGWSWNSRFYSKSITNHLIRILFYWLDCGSWTLYRNKCYKLFETARIWLNALETCQNNDATLVSIPDAETENFLTNRMSSGSSFWAGGRSCNTCTSWRWLDGTPWSFTNWQNSYPKVGNTQRLFVDVDGDKQWYTKDMNDKYYHICQYDYDGGN